MLSAHFLTPTRQRCQAVSHCHSRHPADRSRVLPPVPPLRPGSSPWPRHHPKVPSGRQARRRAARVPQDGVSNGQPGSSLTTAGPKSRPRGGQPYRAPKLSTTDASGGPGSGMIPTLSLKVEVTSCAGIPSHRHRRRSKPGAGGPCRSTAPGADPCPRPRFGPSLPTRRDIRFGIVWPAAGPTNHDHPTLYLPETTLTSGTTTYHRESIRADQTYCSAMTGTVR